MKLRLPQMRCDTGCGACCGPVSCSPAEYKRIADYIATRFIEPQDNGITCPFYQRGVCAIYEVRPMICVAFGHSERLVCNRGYNTNVPDRTIRKALDRNGPYTRRLHEFANVDVFKMYRRLQ